MLTSPATAAIIPNGVLAVMVHSESRDFLLNQSVEVDLWSASVHRSWRCCASAPFDPVLRRHHKAVLVPLWAIARLPPGRAQVAELVPAAARHVETAMGEFDEVVAARAPLPAVLLRQCEYIFVQLR